MSAYGGQSAVAAMGGGYRPAPHLEFLMEKTFTDGTKVIIIEQCDCGLTAGCEKCAPVVFRIEPEVITFETIQQVYEVLKCDA